MTSSMLRPMFTISHKSNPQNFKPLSFKSKIPTQIHNSTTNPIKPISSNTPSMEVELKLRLPNSTTHKNLLSLLSPFHSKTHLQENIFFDTATAALAARRAALRLRFYNHYRRCVLSLKSNPAISGGVSRIEELEHDVDPLLGRACVGEPWRLARLARPNRVLERLGEMGFGGDGLGGLVCLGRFRNVRNVFEWRGLTLEVDETIYEFGVCYEVECESDKIDEAKELIEEFLKSNGIDYSYSRSNKFAIFRSGKLPIV